jgi:energy-converting hydrogenase Eha subunit A
MSARLVRMLMVAVTVLVIHRAKLGQPAQADSMKQYPRAPFGTDNVLPAPTLAWLDMSSWEAAVEPPTPYVLLARQAITKRVLDPRRVYLARQHARQGLSFLDLVASPPRHSAQAVHRRVPAHNT